MSIEKKPGGTHSFFEGYTGFLFKALLTILLIVYVVSKVQYNSIVAMFFTVSIPLFIAGSSLFLVNVFFQYKKWELLSKELLHVTQPNSIIKSLFYGHALGAFTPVRAGEYVGRKIPYNDVTISDCTAATLLDKTSGLLFIYLFGIVALTGNLLTKGVIGKEEYLYNGSVMLSVAIAFLGIIVLAAWLLRKKILALNFIQKFVESLKKFRTLSPRVLIKLGVYSFFVVLSFSAQFALLTKSFSLSHSVIELFWIGSIMFFLKSLIPPITIGELGVRESVTIFSLSFANVSQAAAFNVSISMFFTNIAAPALVGLLMMWLKKK